MTIEQLRADIAEVLKEDESEFENDDNLVDFGLDSIRLMTLIQRWSERGIELKFAELAERPEIDYWWTIIARRVEDK